MTETNATYDCLRATGYDPEILQARNLLVAGCGNVGSNATTTLSVLGISATYVDPDRVERKNLPHSPYLDATPGSDGFTPFKARLLAENHVALSRRPGQVAHWASCPIQALPLGVIQRFDAILIGIDDGPSRAWAARTAALLGIPAVVVGMYPPTGNCVATTNRDPDAPCYFCLRPHESPGRASCALYADNESGIHPALQTAAAATVNVAIEAIVRFWHGDDRFDGRVFRLDLGVGQADLTGWRRDPNCRGPHRRLPEIVPAPFDHTALVEAVLDLARSDGLREPVLTLPSGVYESMPCRECGRQLPVMLPEWQLPKAPSCPLGCPRPRETRSSWRSSGGGSRSGNGIVSVAEVTGSSALRHRSLVDLGIGPLGLCILEDEASDATRVYELPGAMDDFFVTVRKEEP